MCLSVKSEEEERELKIVADGLVTWLGGTDAEEEGVWRWTDGSPWFFTAWIEGKGHKGSRHNCIAWYPGWGWTDANPCSWSNYFICQTEREMFRGETNTSFKYHQDQLTFPGVKVEYHQEVAIKGKIDASKKGGFKLS